MPVPLAAVAAAKALKPPSSSTAWQQPAAQIAYKLPLDPRPAPHPPAGCVSAAQTECTHASPQPTPLSSAFTPLSTDCFHLAWRGTLTDTLTRRLNKPPLCSNARCRLPT